MAPGSIQRPPRKAATVAKIKAQALVQAVQLAKEQNAEHKSKIEELQNLVQEKDETIATLSDEKLQDLEIDAMDLDEDTGESGKDGNEPNSNAGKDGKPDGSGDEEPDKLEPVKVKVEEDAGSLFEPIKKVISSKEDGESLFKPVKKVKFQPSVENDDSLFVRPHAGTYTDPSVESGYEPSPNVYVDPETGPVLLAQPGPDCSGSRPVSWGGERPKLFINMYGPRSHAIYRMQPSCSDPNYEEPEDECYTSTHNTLGQERADNGRGVKYKRNDILGVAGVAMACGGEYPSPADVELINPKHVRSWRGVYTRVLIIWMVGGTRKKPVTKKAWETRATLRSHWGKDTDTHIYEAALKAEERYVFGQTPAGREIAASRSPSVGLTDHLRQQRERSQSVRGSPPPETTKPKPQKAASVNRPTIDKLRDTFLANYMVLLGLGANTSFKDLPRDNKRDCIAAWQEEMMAIEASA